MKHILASLMFGGYVVTAVVALVVARRASTEAGRRRAWSLFLVYSLVASFVPGVTQRNAWPFSDWPLIAGVVPKDLAEVHLVALDAEGNEHVIDPRAWEPLSHRELINYIYRVFQRLPRASQDRAATYLVSVAEFQRQRAAAGGSIGNARKWLGPLRAPYFVLQAHPWDDPDGIPDVPFVALRAYVRWWNVEERRRGVIRERRDVFYEPEERSDAR